MEVIVAIIMGLIYNIGNLVGLYGAWFLHTIGLM